MLSGVGISSRASKQTKPGSLAVDRRHSNVGGSNCSHGHLAWTRVGPRGGPRPGIALTKEGRSPTEVTSISSQTVRHVLTKFCKVCLDNAHVPRRPILQQRNFSQQGVVPVGLKWRFTEPATVTGAPLASILTGANSLMGANCGHRQLDARTARQVLNCNCRARG